MDANRFATLVRRGAAAVDAELTGIGRWATLLVVGLADLLVWWFFLDILLGQGTPHEWAHPALVGGALLACLVASVAASVALVGLWPASMLRIAAACFGGTAVLNVLGEASLAIGNPADQVAEVRWWAVLVVWLTFAALPSLALSVGCARLARTATWRTARWRWPWGPSPTDATEARHPARQPLDPPRRRHPHRGRSPDRALGLAAERAGWRKNGSDGVM